jgi:hypothetical protein
MELGYPPKTMSDAERAIRIELEKRADEAPFGRLKNGKPRTRTMYVSTVRSEKKRLGAIDLRWPFWVGTALGAGALVMLLARRRP